MEADGVTTFGKSETPFGNSSPNSNPNFVPTKISPLLTTVAKIKAPKPPEKPLMPYMRYSRKVWDSVKMGNEGCKLWEIGKIIGQMWRDLAQSEKQIFVEEYEVEKKEYADSMRMYQNSTAYQQYLTAKEKAFQQQNNMEAKRVISGSVGNNHESAATDGKAKQTKDELDGKLSIPPVDGDTVEPFGEHWLRRLATARYHRNQRLLYEVLNETAVPDLRAIVTTSRLTTLKRQVGSLTSHQHRLETEIEQLQMDFEAKKRRMEAANDQFSTRMQQLCGAASSSSTYTSLVEKAQEQLQRDYDSYLQQQQHPPSRPRCTSTSVVSSSSLSSADTSSPAAKHSSEQDAATVTQNETTGGNENATNEEHPSPTNAATTIGASADSTNVVEMNETVLCASPTMCSGTVS